MNSLRRLFPVAAFFAGFILDALSIGQRIREIDFLRLGLFLLGAAVCALWLAWRGRCGRQAPPAAPHLRGQMLRLGWLAPYLLMQFFYGSIFSALFILYFKSSDHLAAWLTAGVLGALLIANEFAGDRYGRRFSLTWSLFALNAILLFNFALPQLIGSLEERWFYASTLAGVLLAQLLWLVSPGRPGRILPAWAIAAALLLASALDMIAPVPLVKRQLAVGQDFSMADGRFTLRVEAAPGWQFWRDQSELVHVAEGSRLYGVSAVYAPRGVSALLEHRWERRDGWSWKEVARRRFESLGGREGGFRAYSWLLAPAPGEWRLIVATQDGRTITSLSFLVQRGQPAEEKQRQRQF